VPDGTHYGAKVMNGTEENGTNNDPQVSGQPPKQVRCSNRSNDGACTSYAGKVVTQKNHGMSGNVVNTIVQFLGWSLSTTVQFIHSLLIAAINNISNDKQDCGYQKKRQRH